MKISNFKFQIYTFLAIIPMLLLTPGVFAQETQRTITIIPPAIQLTLDPGERKEGLLKVINSSNEPLTFTTTIQDYIVIDKNGTPNLLPPNILQPKFSAALWISVVPGTFTIKPHQMQTVQYFVQLPPDARPGGHYASVNYTPVNPEGVEGLGASVLTKLGTLFYITVKGSINEYAKVASFTAPWFQEYGPVKLITSIQNDGDLHIRPEAKISVTDMLGREIVNTPLQEHNIFPGIARDVENTVGTTLLVGRFEAKLIGSYGQNNNLPLTASVVFWVLPWRVSLIIVLAVIALVLLWKLWKRRKHHTQKDINTPQTTNDAAF